MIVVDTSALMAILLDEPLSPSCQAAIEQADTILISAATLAEALIVAGNRNLTEEMAQLIAVLGVEIVPLTAAASREVAAVYARWGKGAHPAALNFGDCFAYQLAVANGCPLLFVGQDFSRTDIASALPAAP